LRIRVSHTTTYAYSKPTRSILQVLRLTPRPHEGQHVVAWKVEADSDIRLRLGEDSFGNQVHTLSTDKPVTRLTLAVTGEVRTADTGGVVAGAVERLPGTVYLRETALTLADGPLRSLAERVAAEAGPDPLQRLHALNKAIHAEMGFETGTTEVTATAAEAYAQRRGVCQDLTHIFLATARRLGIPARYVSGHLLRVDGQVEQDAGHAWAEALAPSLGWVGFDPTNGVSASAAHVRVAIGLDYLDAAPVRGARSGGGEETMAVKLRVAEAARQ
jgi:transglutaminase-like putative cysteine protease